jgi:hypothetical protein
MNHPYPTGLGQDFTKGRVKVAEKWAENEF